MIALTYDVVVPTLGTISANDRAHWARKAVVTRQLRETGTWAAKAALLDAHLFATPEQPLMDRAHLTVSIQWPDFRHRDAANLHPTIKALVDGAVDMHIIPDDDDTHLVGPDLRPSQTLSDGRGLIRLGFVWEELPPSGMMGRV